MNSQWEILGKSLAKLNFDRFFSHLAVLMRFLVENEQTSHYLPPLPPNPYITAILGSFRFLFFLNFPKLRTLTEMEICFHFPDILCEPGCSI